MKVGIVQVHSFSFLFPNSAIKGNVFWEEKVQQAARVPVWLMRWEQDLRGGSTLKSSWPDILIFRLHVDSLTCCRFTAEEIKRLVFMKDEVSSDFTKPSSLLWVGSERCDVNIMFCSRRSFEVSLGKSVRLVFIQLKQLDRSNSVREAHPWCRRRLTSGYCAHFICHRSHQPEADNLMDQCHLLWVWFPSSPFVPELEKLTSLGWK